MYSLGINAVFHDSAACLVKDGKVIAAAEEERFNRVKHAKRPNPFSTYELPFHAIAYCLKEAGITLSQVEHIGYSFEPKLLLPNEGNESFLSLPLELNVRETPAEYLNPWDSLFLCYVMNAPRYLRSGAPHHLQKYFSSPWNGKWHFVEHHLAHAASAFYASPYDRAAVMVLDGKGEKATTSYHLGESTFLERISEVQMPHSLGLLYEEVTTYLGFLHSSDEYKVMALASYGKPTFLREFRQLVTLQGEGQYSISPHCLAELFGPARVPGSSYEAKHFDIAHSLQKVLEETVLELSRWLYDTTKNAHLCMAGGVALNCVMNARIRDEGPFSSVWVQPAAGDAGAALGAALWVDAKERRATTREYVMNHAYLGPSFNDEEIQAFLDWSKVRYRRSSNIAEDTAELLAQEKIIGWFQGRMEFGPRALGARSLLASPLHASMQDKLNEVKDREDFRPVAPVVLEEKAEEWFNNPACSPFMLFVNEVRPEKASQIPAVRHVDGTARIQTVNQEQHPLYYDLLQAFERRTGVPVLVNTSFNTRGEPIVGTPRDALECFWTSPLDALVIGSFIVEK